MKTKKIIFSAKTERIDNKTGEIFETEIISKMQVDREPDYVKMYVKDIIRFKDLPTGMDKVLMAIISNMSYTNIIFTYMPIKKFISSNLNITVSYVNKCISHYIKTGLLIKVERGIYLVDPELFARGKWENINELRLSITYDTKTGEKKIRSNIKEQLRLNL